MKKLFTAIGLAALLAGCASHDKNNGMGGVSDDTMKTDSIHSNGSSSDQFNNNANNGTSSSTATNSDTGSQGTPQQ
jgi:uncharacterized protein YcfL